jgi:hypothetical protein
MPGALSAPASDINNAGQIVGAAFHPFTMDGFLATPISEVPEPSSLALFCIGIIALSAICRRQRT